MRKEAPRIVTEAIADGVWRDPGPEALRRLLGGGLDLGELELFETLDTMHRVSEQLNAAGYVDDSEFCMTHVSGAGIDDCDPRLVFEHALFIAGSTMPGDDVLVAVDLCSGDEDPTVLVFDWHKSIPRRWVVVGALREFVENLKRCQKM